MRRTSQAGGWVLCLIVLMIVIFDADPVSFHHIAVANLSDVDVLVSEQGRVADDLLSCWVVDVALKPGITQF